MCVCSWVDVWECERVRGRIRMGEGGVGGRRGCWAGEVGSGGKEV